MRAGNFKATFNRYLPELPTHFAEGVKSFTDRYSLSADHRELVVNFFIDMERAHAVYPEAALLGLKAYLENDFERGSDTVFILGCGASLNQLADADWARVAKVDSIGINYFYCHPFRPTAHVIELGLGGESLNSLRYNLLEDDSRGKEGVFLHMRHILNHKQLSHFKSRANTWLYSPCVPKSQYLSLIEAYLCEFYSRSGPLFHHASNLDCALHIAYQMGYERILFLGVDLNHRDYFWDSMNPSSGPIADVKKSIQEDFLLHKFDEGSESVHATVDPVLTARCNSLAVTDYLALINEQQMQPSGVTMATCTPSSLLREYIDYLPLKSL